MSRLFHRLSLLLSPLLIAGTASAQAAEPNSLTVQRPTVVFQSGLGDGGGVWKNSFKLEDYSKSKTPVMLNKKLQPHPWSVGDMAYREMLEEGKNQAVLICGESGAGKTGARSSLATTLAAAFCQAFAADLC